MLDATDPADPALLDASVSDAAIAEVEDVANPPGAASPMCVVATTSPRRAEAMMLFEKYMVAVVCDVKE
jgi:hypothetical protein